jgi:two-component system chemotaxis response regulator CheY
MTKMILAVDDSSSLRMMVVFSLKKAGYDVVEAVDGQDGLNKAKEKTFDLVLTDHNMPVMDGLTLIKHLRELGSYQRVPILMLTTESSVEMKEQGRAAGANGWLVKPFDPERLVTVVKTVLAT